MLPKPFCGMKSLNSQVPKEHWKNLSNSSLCVNMFDILREIWKQFLPCEK